METSGISRVVSNIIVVDGFDLQNSHSVEWSLSTEEWRHICKLRENGELSGFLQDHEELRYSCYIQEILQVCFHSAPQTLHLYADLQRESAKNAKKQGMSEMCRPNCSSASTKGGSPKLETDKCDPNFTGLSIDTVNIYRNGQFLSCAPPYNLYPVSYCTQPYKTYPVEETILYIIKDQFKFQADNLYTNLEDATLSILNSIPPTNATTLGLSLILEGTRKYHKSLFENYLNWCAFLGAQPFPWIEKPWEVDQGHLQIPVSHPEENERKELAKIMFEIGVFRMIYIESANIRHCPEMLAWLFHWALLQWRHSSPAHDPFIYLIQSLIQRIRDEQWDLGVKGEPPDHKGKLNYDDFNEIFWTPESVHILRAGEVSKVDAIEEGMNFCYDREYGCLEMKKEILYHAVSRLLCDSISNKGVKTFIEQRSYLQVIRCVWRIIHFHIIWLFLCLGIRARLDRAGPEFYWRWALISSCLCGGVYTLMCVVLAGGGYIMRTSTWTFNNLFSHNLVHLLRLCFFILAVFFLSYDPVALGHDSIFSLSYMGFYFAHACYPFLFIKFGSGRVGDLGEEGQKKRKNSPFMNFLKKTKLNHLFPTEYVGTAEYLVPDLKAVLHYGLFWTVVILTKSVFWIFGSLPTIMESSAKIPLVTLRPYYTLGFTLLSDPHGIALRILLWVPIALLWLFDMQIFFLIFGALYGTLIGHMRRVGYVKRMRAFKTHLLPTLCFADLFRVPSPGVGGGCPAALKSQVSLQQGSVEKNQLICNGEKEQDLGYQPLATGDVYCQMPEIERNKEAILEPEERKNVERKKSFFEKKHSQSLLETETTSSQNNTGELDSDKIILNDKKLLEKRVYERRKTFAYVWNEIVYSWRQEDIISHDEYGRLEFNELPIFIMPNSEFDRIRVDDCCVDWRNSRIRYPSYIYLDTLPNFFRICEAYHLRVHWSCSMPVRLRLARRFYSKYLKISDFSPTKRLNIPMEAISEISEAFFYFLARYNVYGAILIHAIRDLGIWVTEDPGRLVYINMSKILTTVKTLSVLFSLAEKVNVFTAANRAQLQKCIVALRYDLMELLNQNFLRQNKLANCSVALNFANAVRLCFSAPFKSDIMQVTAPSVSPLELQAIVTQILYEFHRRSTEMVMEKEAVRPEPGSLPMSLNRISTLRALLKVGNMVYLENSPGIFRGDHYLKGDSTPNRKTASHSWLIEHALRMHYRRAANILENYQPLPFSQEAARRLKYFGSSLLMHMPASPTVAGMCAMTTLTPYYREDASLDLSDLEQPTEAGVSKMELLRSLYPVEFRNFLERTDREGDMFRIHQELESRVAESAKERAVAISEARHHLQNDGLLHRYDKFKDALQFFASMRGQVLTRTVRGFMYYTQAIQIQHFIETSDLTSLHLRFDSNRLDKDQLRIVRASDSALWWNEINVSPIYQRSPSSVFLSRVKHQFIVAAQEFGKDKKLLLVETDLNCEPKKLNAEQLKNLKRAVAIVRMMDAYPNLRIATIEEGDLSHKKCVLYKLKKPPFQLDPHNDEIESFIANRQKIESFLQNTLLNQRNGPHNNIRPTPPNDKQIITQNNNSPENSKKINPKNTPQNVQEKNPPKIPDENPPKIPSLQNLPEIHPQNTPKVQQKFPSLDNAHIQALKQMASKNPEPRAAPNDKNAAQKEIISEQNPQNNSTNLDVKIPKKKKKFFFSPTTQAAPPTFSPQHSARNRRYSWNCDADYLRDDYRDGSHYSMCSPHNNSRSPFSKYNNSRASLSLRAFTNYDRINNSCAYFSVREPPQRDNPYIDFYLTRPQNTGPQNLGPQNLGPQNLGPQNLGPQNTGPHNMGPHNLGPHNMGPQNMGPQNLGPQNTGPQNCVSNNWWDSIYPADHTPLSRGTPTVEMGPESSMYFNTISPFGAECPTLNLDEDFAPLPLEELSPGNHKQRRKIAKKFESKFSISSSPYQTSENSPNFRHSLTSQHNLEDIYYQPPQEDDVRQSENLANERLVGRLQATQLLPFEGTNSEARPRKKVLPSQVLEPPPLPALAELEQVYQIFLPSIFSSNGCPCTRYPIIGPGKPENQNASVIFARGDKVQAIDMNMDSYLEDAFKLRNLLQEFRHDPNLRILGFREHIFTQNVSSLASYMALQENLFTTTSQRFYDEPLRARMHYGHPDVFHRPFVETCGNSSKASNGINLSEDVFAGYNATNRGFRIKQIDYMQCGKGRDVGLQQIFLFEKKVTSGNAEQLLSRDVCRLLKNSDFFRSCSIYYSGVGFFLNALLLLVAAFVTLYSKCFASLAEYSHKGVFDSNISKVIAPTTYIQFQLGLLLILPLVLFTLLEHGFSVAFSKLFNIIIKLGVFYYNFMLASLASMFNDTIMIGSGARREQVALASEENGEGEKGGSDVPLLWWNTFVASFLFSEYDDEPEAQLHSEPPIATKAAVVDQVLMYGGAKYEETGRGFVIAHADFVTLWKFYFTSHFTKGLELILLLVIYASFSGHNIGVYLMDSWPFWIMAVSFIWVPFIFNPLGLFYNVLSHDFAEWNRWMRSSDLSKPGASWRAWICAEMHWRGGISWHNRIILILKVLRFVMLSVLMTAVISAQLDSSDLDTVVYIFAGFGVLGTLGMLAVELRYVSPSAHAVSGATLLLAFITIVTWAIVQGHITFMMVVTTITAIWLFTYGILELSLALLGRWGGNMLISAMRVYHVAAGYLLFAPPYLLSAFTISFNKIQNRILFNTNFVQIVKSGIDQKRDLLKKGH